MAVERLDLGEDDGWLDVVVEGREYRVDVWQANDVIYDYAQANKNQQGTAFYRGLAGELQKLGLPPLSNALVPRFMAGINDKVTALKKNASSARDSHDSSTSTPEVSAPSSDEPTTN